MEFYGMASKTAMDRHNVPHREYRGVEGKTVSVPYRGPVNNTIIDILSGIRSACTYVGAKRLKSLSKVQCVFHIAFIFSIPPKRLPSPRPLMVITASSHLGVST